MTRVDDADLRRLQQTELGLLERFRGICARHHLRYYMVGGTMLGAVRHGGFIPWDDDADAAMPRRDYEEFLRIAPDELPEGFSRVDHEHTPDYMRPFARLYDESVRVTIGSNTQPVGMPAWIDIFPLDGMPKGRARQLIHFWHMTFWRFWYHASFPQLNLNRPGRPLYMRLLIRFLALTHLGEGADTKKLIRRTDRLLKRYDFDESDTVVSFYGAYMTREIVEKRLFGEGKAYPFETLTLTGPSEPDEFLRHFYGDYIRLPDEEKRDTHHVISIEYNTETARH